MSVDSIDLNPSVEETAELKQLGADVSAHLHQGRLDIWLSKAEAKLPGVKRQWIALLIGLILTALLAFDCTGPLTCALLTLTYPMVDTLNTFKGGNGATLHQTVTLVICMAAGILDAILAGCTYRLLKSALLIAIQKPHSRLNTLIHRRLAGPKEN